MEWSTCADALEGFDVVQIGQVEHFDGVICCDLAWLPAATSAGVGADIEKMAQGGVEARLRNGMGVLTCIGK